VEQFTQRSCATRRRLEGQTLLHLGLPGWSHDGSRKTSRQLRQLENGETEVDDDSEKQMAI